MPDGLPHRVPLHTTAIGDVLRIRILSVGEDLTLRVVGAPLRDDPWADAAHRYPVGTLVRGRVVLIADFGAFVELEGGIEALLHVSELRPGERLTHRGIVEAMVLSVDTDRRQISLGTRQLGSA